jgi:hypothetical protein
MAKPCPDCKDSRDASTGTYTYGSETTGYKTSSDLNVAKKKHQMAYPNAYVRPSAPTPAPTPNPTPPPKKKGGPITAMDKVQDMYSKMYSKKKK